MNSYKFECVKSARCTASFIKENLNSIKKIDLGKCKKIRDMEFKDCANLKELTGDFSELAYIGLDCLNGTNIDLNFDFELFNYQHLFIYQKYLESNPQLSSRINDLISSFKYYYKSDSITTKEVIRIIRNCTFCDFDLKDEDKNNLTNFIINYLELTRRSEIENIRHNLL